MATLPVIDAAAPFPTGPLIVPHFADGAGWSTQILLVNPATAPLSGMIEFRDAEGALVNVTIGGVTHSSFQYSIPPRSSQRFATAGALGAAMTGSVRVIPSSATAPVSQVIFAYKPGGATVSHAGVPTMTSTAFRTYVESAGISGTPGNIQSGIAIANTAGTPVSVSLELTDMDGRATGLNTTISLPGFGQTSRFLSQFFPALPGTFQGVLRIAATGPISVVGLRARYNEIGDFLITTTPPADELAPASSEEMLFPQLADGGGYTTQFILFNGSPGQSSSGVLRFVGSQGQTLNLTLR